MKKLILLFSLIGMLTLNGCKKDFFNLRNISIGVAVTIDKIINPAAVLEVQAPFVQIEEKKNINDGIHKSDAASSTVELENKIDSIINQIGALP